jgi:aminoglycoside/choline kinase family phosphotransferase
MAIIITQIDRLKIQQAVRSYFQQTDHMAHASGNSVQPDPVDLGFVFTKLPGDASTRQYYRLQGPGQQLIVMKVDPATGHKLIHSFLSIQNFFQSNQLPVPEVVYSDVEDGVIVLEDLGDSTFIKKLIDVDGEAGELIAFKSAIDILVKLHAVPVPNPGPDQLGDLNQRFDLDKLLWEVDHTIENLFKQHLRRVFTPADVKVMLGEFVRLCTILAEQKMVVTHRDYHSRNIMVTLDERTGQERLVVIDFQDARLGARQYDLASLLKDSYYHLTDSQVEKLVNYYIDEVEKLEGITLDRAEFFQIFDLMAVQRNFKAIGTFASIMNKRTDVKYLKYIGNTFENIRRTLIKYPEFDGLRKVLCKYYYF